MYVRGIDFASLLFYIFLDLRKCSDSGIFCFVFNFIERKITVKIKAINSKYKFSFKKTIKKI